MFDKVLSEELRREARERAYMAALRTAVESASGLNAVLYWMERERDELVKSVNMLVRKAALAADTRSLASMGYELCRTCGTPTCAPRAWG